MKFRITADDFGISPGVNFVVEKMFREGRLHATSLMCYSGYFAEAVTIALRNPGLDVGLHFRIKNKSFAVLLLQALTDKKNLQKEIESELHTQIALLEKVGIKPTHIDSHRHIHMIPGIFSVVSRVVKEQGIARLRVVNESLLTTAKINHSKTFLWNGNLVKWLILSIFRVMNGEVSQRYFFSILYSCQITKELLSKIKIPENFSEVEVMIHPGNPQMDEGIADLEERSHLMSVMRKTEAGILVIPNS
ncbi:MAG: ChbG/HpnK family deacetylase [Alphaproteobacteria bacterium]|nr:ChbG/HpnK family deacetylase [Alphaproteobacteria bacterium]